MTANTFFEIFLVIQVLFLIGLAVVSARHARAHKSESPAQPETVVAGPPPTMAVEDLPSATQEQLLRMAEKRFEAAVNHAATQLQTELEHSGVEVNKLLQRLATDIVSKEMEHYHAELVQLQQQAKTGLSTVRAEAEKNKAQMEAQMAQEIGAEKLRLLKQIDTKLADAVASFLTEALQHNIDLGSQQTYLIGLLEQHKKDFVKELADEPTASK